MPKSASYIPTGYHTVTPFLIVRDVAGFLDFAQKAFGGEVTNKVAMPDGSILHAELKIGDTQIMVGPTMGEMPPATAMLYHYVPDADATYRQAIAAGASSVDAPADQFWGDRAGAVTDPAGNTWWIATKVEEVPRDELLRRSSAMASGEAQHSHS